MKPEISRYYDHRPEDWYFTRDTRLARNTFPMPRRQRAVEWLAVVIAGVFCGIAAVIINYYYF